MQNTNKRILVSILLFIFSITMSHSAAFADNNSIPSAGRDKTGVYLDEIGTGTGYAWGTLQNHADDLAVYPGFLRFGFNVNSLFGIKGGTSKVQFILEPFYNTIDSPLSGYETGCSIGLRYLHELAGAAGIYFEGSFAPMYLSIDTTEQGAGGFNFLDQFGAGLQFRLSDKSAVFAGYRFRHTSNASLVDRSNSGINSNAFIIGLSWLY
jgi:lipid A 3-O-deacylase